MHALPCKSGDLPASYAQPDPKVSGVEEAEREANIVRVGVQGAYARTPCREPPTSTARPKVSSFHRSCTRFPNQHNITRKSKFKKVF